MQAMLPHNSGYTLTPISIPYTGYLTLHVTPCYPITQATLSPPSPPPMQAILHSMLPHNSGYTLTPIPTPYTGYLTLHVTPCYPITQATLSPPSPSPIQAILHSMLLHVTPLLRLHSHPHLHPLYRLHSHPHLHPLCRLSYTPCYPITQATLSPPSPPPMQAILHSMLPHNSGYTLTPIPTPYTGYLTLHVTP